MTQKSMEESTGSTENTETVLRKIADKQTIVGIVGMGYVGLPLAIRFADAGFKVIGFDIDERKVQALERGESYIEHISAKKIQSLRRSGFQATMDFRKGRE